MTTITTERSFQTDSLAPLLIDVNLEHYDHLQHSTNQQLRFEIYDRPILPGSMTLMLWREWLNDYNFNDWPDEEEYVPFQLAVPGNLSMSQGNYTFTYDDNPGTYGDKVAGYLVGSDPAGNPLLDGGGPGPDDHLFMYELALDGAPIAYGENATMDGDRQPWLHPGNEYEFIIPFTEPNGFRIPSPCLRHSSIKRSLTAERSRCNSASKLPAQASVIFNCFSFLASPAVSSFATRRNGQRERCTLVSINGMLIPS